MGLMKRIRSLFFKPSFEDTIASFAEELDNGQRRLFLEYEHMRVTLNFTGATTALESLLARDTNEKHREFYRCLIDEMKTISRTPNTT